MGFIAVLGQAISILSNPQILKEVSEVLSAGIVLTEAISSHKSGEEKKQDVINLSKESLDLIFLKFTLPDPAIAFIKETLVIKLIDVIVWGLNTLNVFKQTDKG